MNQLLKEIDFSVELTQTPLLKEFLKDAAKQILNQQEDAFKRIKKPIFDQQLQNHLIITGLPLIKTEEQYKKLPTAVKGVINNKKIPGLLQLQIEWDGTRGNGTAFAIFDTAKNAKFAFNKLNQFKFTPKHTLLCFTVKNAQQVYNFTSKYSDPIFISTKQKQEWNINQNGLDQFIFRQVRKDETQSKISVKWFDNFEKTTNDVLENEVLVTKQAVTRSFFSPKGTYLVVCNQQGFYLHAGKELQQKAFYKQEGVLDVKFSNDEKYMVSFNGDQTYAKSKQNIIIWSVQQEIKIKAYRASTQQNLQSVQFSDDSKKISIVLSNEVHFFNIESVQSFKHQLKLPEQELELTNILKAQHVQKTKWLKSKNSATLIVMCYDPDFQPNLQPITRIFLYNTETKEQMKWKAWGHHIKKGQIIVSDKGDWAAICVKKFMKKNLYNTVIQIGNLQKKELQFENLQFTQKIGNVSWDPARGKFAVMVKSTEKSIVAKYIATFYEIISQKRDQKVVKIGIIPQTLCNRVYISQNGTFFALYNIDQKSSQRGRFTFGVFTKEQKDKKKAGTTNLQIIKANLSVAYMTFFKVDPSGRFILLGTEKGYQIWNIIGEQLFKDSFTNQIKDASWRPRFQTSLQNEEKQNQLLIDNWKKIKQKHEQLDLKRVNILQFKRKQQKNRLKNEFEKWISKKREWYKGFNNTRQKLLGFNQSNVKTKKYQVIQKVDE